MKAVPLDTRMAELEGLLARYDASLKFETGTGCAWSGELRLTLTNPPGKPSRSVTFYAVGGMSPNDLAGGLLADVLLWLSESHQEPLPPPYWLTGSTS
jgi:hypothetical protein